MSLNELRRRKRELMYEHRELIAEEYDLADNPDYIRHFEEFYVHKGYSIRKISKIIDGMEQFPRPLKIHMKEHSEVLIELRRVNRKIIKKLPSVIRAR